MSEHKSHSHSKARSHQRHSKQVPMFAPLSNKQVQQTDWSLLSGRWPHMNDPHLDNTTYNFIETDTQVGLLNTSTSISQAFGTYSALNGVPNASNYAALFDQYRIVQVEIWIVPQIGGSGGILLNAGTLLKTVVDYDNTTTTATQAYFDDFANCHTTGIQSGHYRRYTPHVATAAYSGAFTSFSNVPAPWIDTASNSVQHYGLKIYSDATPLGAISVDVITRYHLQFRNKI